MPSQTMKHPYPPPHQAALAPRGRPRRSPASPGRLALLLCLCVAAAAAAAAAPADDELIRGPDVTIIAQEERTVFEYRQGGELRMIRVVPRWGKPYYLVPSDRTTNFGDLERAERLLPSWVIIEF